METRTARPFSFAFNTSDYRILLVDHDQDRIYLGSREYVVALDMQNINKEPLIIHWPATEQRLEECRMAGKGEQGECANYVRLIAPWNRTHLYSCGTGAYSPVCSFINRGWRSEEYLFRLVPGKETGKGKCPYDPWKETVAAVIDGNLYAGVQVDFMGMDTAIFRTLGRRPAVRTEQYDSRWLNEPVFIKIHMIPDSSEKNDDKLYFFFREKSLEAGSSPSVVSRVGRVCLNDDGGQRSLVNKWTTFLKARLVCSVVGGDGVETYFDKLRDVFIQLTQDDRNPMVYAVFSTSGSVFTGSAVCVYTMADIRNVFNGPFSHKQGHNYQWTPYMGKIPYPQPGTCPGGTFTPGVRTTKDFSDEVVNFVHAHPLMYTPVYPVNRRPLVVRTGVDYRFTTIAVDLVDAVDGRYEVLFLGTDRGTVQKVIVLPKDHSTTEELTLEEVELFKQQLYVSSDGGLTQMSLHRCGVYGKACSDCCLARDPYCAWDGEKCTAFTPTAKRLEGRQNCPGGTFTPGVRTTKDFSDEVVNFVRAHPLMYTPVYPVNRRPLVVRTGVDYRFTTIAVDLVNAVDGRYEVLFLGTDRGTVQKVIVLPKDHSTTEELTLEEVELFKTSFPVKTMKISSKRQQLYVSSDGGLTQMSLHRCGVYGKACSDCCLARDPYCAWDGEKCTAFTPTAKRRSRRQDIKHGDPLRQCRGFNAKVEKRLKETTQFAVEGSSTFLECQPRSPQASVKWFFQKDGTGRRQTVRGRDHCSPNPGLEPHATANTVTPVISYGRY
ncbi:UNVERIFIED_CONTAM: hypothetical protein FKN15_013540 [Acipenser sinensis]